MIIIIIIIGCPFMKNRELTFFSVLFLLVVLLEKDESRKCVI